MSAVVAPGKLLTVTRCLAARLNKSLRNPLTIESPTMIVPSLGLCSPWPFSLVSLFSICSCWFWELALPFFFFFPRLGLLDLFDVTVCQSSEAGCGSCELTERSEERILIDSIKLAFSC